MFRRVVVILLGLLAILLVAAGVAYLGRHELLRRIEGLPSFTHSAGEARDQWVEMRDGVKLATKVYESEGDGPWPTVLIRNPYAQMKPIVGSWCDRLARYGYACVYQDVRGQGESDGDWEPAVNEGRDGSDMLRWLAKQPFVDGNIAMIGPSYLAAVQWAAVTEPFPPELKTFIPSVYSTDNYATLYEDGMFRHETFTAWAALMAMPGEMGGEESGRAYQQAIRHLPHLEVDEEFFNHKLDWYRDWISNPAPADPLWSRSDNQQLRRTPETLDIPIMMIGGWYDVFFGPQWNDWQRLASRSKSRFIIGPWTHIGRSGKALDTPDAGGGLLQWNLMLDWLGHHLRGDILEHAPGVSTYVMRENRWVDRVAWPPEGRTHRLHLAGANGATRCGGGRLQEEASIATELVQYTYDPQDPVPTRGGSGMLAFILPDFDGAEPATVWQGDLCDRADVLSFQTPSLKKPLHIAGTIEVALTIASDAADTAFTAKLVEVLPDGRAVNIRDGITSLALRNGATEAMAYEPGESVEIHLRLWPIEWFVAAGSSLRLDISSSDFPKYHAHPNQSGVWSHQKESKPARQSLLLGDGAAAWVEFPIIGVH